MSRAESMCVDIGLQLLSDKRVCRRQRKAYRSCSAKLHEYWQQYLNIRTHNLFDGLDLLLMVKKCTVTVTHNFNNTFCWIKTT